MYMNLFKEKTESELILLYRQFLESEKTGIIAQNELGEIRDKYCEWFQSNVLYILERDLLHTVCDLWFSEHKPNEDETIDLDTFIQSLQENYKDALDRGFDSIVLAIDTDIGNTYYVNDTSEGFQCDLWDYYFDDLEEIASQLYDEIHGNVVEIRIE